MGNKSYIVALLPMLLGYFVMGFIDVVGISTSYVSADFAGRLPAEVFGFLPSVVFLWFLLLAIPTAMAMNRIGRKTTVMASMLFTLVGVVLPWVVYDLWSVMVGFALVGIGNTILQVGINPLISNVVADSKMTSVLTVGQVLKGACALSGPFVAGFAAREMGSWRGVFMLYAAVTVVTAVWLVATPVPREKMGQSTSIRATFSLLGDGYIRMLFFAMMAFVAIDIGTNTEAPRLLMERLGLDPSLTASVSRTGHAAMPYFACRLVGALAGAFILARVDGLRYFRVNVAVLVAAIVGLAVAGSEWLILGLVGVIGLACSSLFPVIMTMAMRRAVGRENEVSGLLITAICGGAIISPVMSYAVKLGGGQVWAVAALAVVALFLNFAGWRLGGQHKKLGRAQ